MRTETQTRTRYVIINGFSARNAGDAAIVLATAHLLDSVGSAEIKSATRYHEQDREFYARHGIKVIPPIVPFPPRPDSGGVPTRAVHFAVGALAALLLVRLGRRRPQTARRVAARVRLHGLSELLNADRVVVCGGGYLYSANRRINLTLLHAALCTRLASAAGKRPLMMPQSVGPLTRSHDRLLVRWGFSHISPIVSRDEISHAEARVVLRNSRADFRVCPDVAFAGWPAARDPVIDASESSRRIGIVAMDWTWAQAVDPPRALKDYVEKLSDVANQLVSKGYVVHLFGHSRIPEMEQDDVAVAEQVVEACANNQVVLDIAGSSGDVDVLRQRFSEMSVVVGTRLHACIIAMTAGTPAIGLAYQPKTVGTFRMLDLERECFDVATFTASELVSAVVAVSEDDRVRRFVTERVATARAQVVEFYERETALR